MYKFKVSEKLADLMYEVSNKSINEKEFSKKIEKQIDKVINKIASAVHRNQVTKQTLIKKNNSLNKIFKNLLKINDEKLPLEIQEKLSKEIKTYVTANGYIQLDECILTCQNHKVSIINK